MEEDPSRRPRRLTRRSCCRCPASAPGCWPRCLPRVTTPCGGATPKRFVACAECLRSRNVRPRAWPWSAVWRRTADSATRLPLVSCRRPGDPVIHGKYRAFRAVRPASADVAPPGHDAVPDAVVGRGASGALCRARGPTSAGAVGGCAVALHGAVRGDGDRLAGGRELRGGGPAVSVELGPGVGDPGTGRAAGTVAARGGRVASLRLPGDSSINTGM